ncbi:glycerol-3-phosphate cytidylyltransferase [Virgibacillus sp. W0430]|uniref:glycerol-3-phosphate cytidylyltransferase n=1 Tax=Virgibacillus sp. W0430 TaxID=3391580 RepID=UPI003F48BE0C
MKKVITYGTFDLIHPGHINILKRAKQLGDYLIVALSTDEFNSKKNKQAYYNYANRKVILESIQYVDKVIPEISWEQKIEDIRKYNIDTFVMGDDWEGKFDFLQKYCEVVYLPRTIGISTTKIKNDLHMVHNG